jgi:RNA polymerase primary sigma factor
MFIFQKKFLSELTEKNLGLVNTIARRYKAFSVEKDDLIQAGCIGLLRAQRRFTPEKKIKFSTYAGYWIKNEMMREIQKHLGVSVPEYMLAKIRKLSIVSDDLEQRLDRKPSLQELASATGMTVENVAKLKNTLIHTVSLDKPFSEFADSNNLHEIIEDQKPNVNSVSQMAIDNELKLELEKVLSQLPAIEAKVLSLRFGLKDGEEKTLAEIADIFGVSRERVRQIESKGLRRIRAKNGAREAARILRSYLKD